MSNFLSDHEVKYLYAFAELGDERKALTRIFGKYTPRKRHSEILNKKMARKKLKEIVSQAVADMEQGAYASLRKLTNIQNANLNDIMDLQTGQFHSDIDDCYVDAIKSIKYDAESGAVLQVTMHDKLRAVETGMKFTGLLNKQVDVNVNLSITEQLRADNVPDSEVDVFLKKFLAAPDDAIEAEVTETEKVREC